MELCTWAFFVVVVSDVSMILMYLKGCIVKNVLQLEHGNRVLKTTQKFVYAMENDGTYHKPGWAYSILD